MPTGSVHGGVWTSGKCQFLGCGWSENEDIHAGYSNWDFYNPENIWNIPESCVSLSTQFPYKWNIENCTVSQWTVCEIPKLTGERNNSNISIITRSIWKNIFKGPIES